MKCILALSVSGLWCVNNRTGKNYERLFSHLVEKLPDASWMYKLITCYWYSGIMTHSSTLVFKSQLFVGALQRALVSTSFRKCSIWFKWDDCLDCCLIWKHMRVNFAMWIIVLLEGSATFHLYYPGGWEQVQIKNFPIQFHCMMSASSTREETNPCHCWHRVVWWYAVSVLLLHGV